MSILKIWVRWFCAAWMPIYFGGDSSSDSSTRTETKTTNNTTTEDRRVVGGDNSLGVSGNGNSVVMTDNGAVKQAIELAGTSSVHIVDALKAMATANQASFEKTLALVGDNTEKTNAAFAKANEEVNGNRTLVIVGMVAVGMIAMQQGIFK
ncbi:hypothetical protein Hsero_2367 [Herbaspirillum seropedicae SmR1]|uniref:Uncharacterized protein n=1 Tax=Herbaspirillum seropedicae (strain SmR1) TaxID=757424 RepID=D8IVC7_HERSS|nr:hypothetical protein [Herbaspirillum seropedicae]ADJ63866.1 hypothetical protein Hsero_2367 [Herbaspirillum seropedicae SmR1]